MANNTVELNDDAFLKKRDKLYKEQHEYLEKLKKELEKSE